MTSAILLNLGYGGKSDDTMTGMYKLRNRLRAEHPSTRVELLEHDDANGIAAFATEVAGYDWVAQGGHSFGIGHALPVFAAAIMDAGREIDFVFAIDPVPFVGTHFLIDLAPLSPYPVCIHETLLFRTLNKPGFFYPWSRDIADASVYKRVIFGPRPGQNMMSPNKYVLDPLINHATIDDSEFVHDEVCADITERIGR